MDIKELSLVNPDEHWYYQSKLWVIRKVVKRFAPSARRYVDVGAGSGFFGRRIPDFESGAQSTCVDLNYEHETEDLGGALLYRKHAPSSSADVYLFIDVLEHVESELALLADYTKPARSGAIFVVTVPAFMCMWSGHDEFLGHFRRYRLHEVTQVLNAAGLEVLKSRYLFGGIFPIAWLVRRIQRGSRAKSSMRTAPRVLNAILRTFIVMEHRFPWNRIAGVSAMVVARKP